METMKASNKLKFFHTMRGSSYSGMMVILENPISEYKDVAEKHYPAAFDHEGEIDYRMIIDGGDLMEAYCYPLSTVDIGIFYQNAGGKQMLIDNLNELREQAAEQLL